MEGSLIPSLSEGIVGSRFITEDEVDTAKQRREEQWKAAYARLVLFYFSLVTIINFLRLGQEPPPQQQEEVYDGRSLAEVSIPSNHLIFRSYSRPAVGLDITRRNLLPTELVLRSSLVCSILYGLSTDSKTRRMGGKDEARLIHSLLFASQSHTTAFSANQFRALEEDEIMFLDSIRERQEEEERQRKEKDGEEVRNFKECV